MKQKSFAVIVVLIIALWTIPAYAMTTPEPGDTLSVNDDSVQITKAGSYTLTGTGAVSRNTITVAPNIDGEVNLTLSGVHIDVSAVQNVCAVSVGTGTTVNLNITGTNILKSGKNKAGLNVPVGAVLTIDGTGSLSATSGEDGAGIGGNKHSGAGKINIKGGTVTAFSIADGAGIGGGCYGTGKDAAGIGGGKYSNGGNITINGGTVIATGGVNGAGIGGGYGYEGGNITINAGTVIATGGRSAAGIGGGVHAEGGNIRISGGIVIANAGGQGAGIGGGCPKLGGSIDIAGGEIYATGGPAIPTTLINEKGHDIGDGAGANTTEHTNFRLSGNAAVFMGSCDYAMPTHRDFKTLDLPIGNFKDDYGYKHFPAAWGNQNIKAYIYNTVYYYVDFVPRNGFNIDSQAVDQGGKVTKPNDLLKTGFVFAGWYSDASYNDANEWDFDTDTVEKATTLYAKWTVASQCTVTFDSASGSAVDSQTIDEGEKALKPDAPIRIGYSFGGWYTDIDCHDDDRRNFSVCTVMGDMTLYAKWNSIVAVDTPNLLMATIGEDYSCTITASGGDGNYSWYASGLPCGLSMTKENGIISGKPNETGTFSVNVTVYDGENKRSIKVYSLDVNSPSATGKYTIMPEADSAYIVSTTDGLTTLTINSDVSGFRVINASIDPVVAHEGSEFVVFTHTRNGVQIGYSFNKADFDITNATGAGFNIKAGDIIKIFVVDTISNDANINPILLQ